MGILASLPAATAPAAPAVFTNLMNLLLALPANDSESEPEQTAPAQSAQEIADAMIRSMLGGTPGSAGQSSNIYNDAPPAKPDQKKQAPTTPTAAITVPVIAAPLPNPQLGPADPAQSSSSKLPFGASIITPQQAQPATPKGELAFALKLTPANTADAAQPAPAVPVDPAAGQAQDAPQPDPKQADTPRAQAPSIAEVKSHAPSDSRDDATPVVTAAAAISEMASHDNAFGQTFAQAAPAQPAAHAATASAPVANAAEAMRASEPAPVQNTPVAHTGAAQEIAVRIARPDSPSVDVHLTERAGQIQVSVRTPDSGLQTSLRQDLGTLVNSLERSGFRTESVTAPAGAAPLNAASQQNGAQNHRDQSESGSGQQDFQNQAGQQRQQQQPRDQRSQKWIEELEKQA